MFGYGLGISAHKKSELLDFQGVPWCGKQDLKRPRAINLKQYKCQKALFFNGFFQFEKIWENHEKRQLHSQLHSNCIQKMAVLTLPRTTTCSSSMAGFFLFTSIVRTSLLFQQSNQGIKRCWVNESGFSNRLYRSSAKIYTTCLWKPNLFTQRFFPDCLVGKSNEAFIMGERIKTTSHARTASGRSWKCRNSHFLNAIWM